MQFFDDETFKDFLDFPTYEEEHAWGIERRFRVTDKKILDFVPILRDTLYRHHSSFNVSAEISALRFPLSAEAMRARNSGLPNDLKTRMANLGEIIGAEFARTYLKYQTTIIFPKRLNPNPDQSMKGVDVLGFREENLSPELLLGEVKSYTNFKREAISEAYTNLLKLSQNKKSSIILHFAKEYFSILQDSVQIKNIDRHMGENTPKGCFLLSITQATPRKPFSAIPLNSEIQLLAVHIQLEKIRSFLPGLFT